MALNPRNLALNFLSYRDRTCLEMQKYLERKGCDCEQVSDTLDFLKQDGLINDETFCLRYVLSGVERQKGPLRLKRELAEKGVDSDVIQMSIESEYDRRLEQDIAYSIAHKIVEQYGKKEAFSDEDSKSWYEKKNKLMGRIARRLSSQGFNTDVIYDVVRKLGQSIE